MLLCAMELIDQLKAEMATLNRKLDTAINILRNLPVKSQENLGDWLNEDQAQELLGYRTTSLWTLRRTGKVEYSKMGGKNFYRRESIIEYLEKNAQKRRK